MCRPAMKIMSDDEIRPFFAHIDDNDSHDSVIQNDEKCMRSSPCDDSDDYIECYDTEQTPQWNLHDDKRKKKVSFGYVAIRYYPITLGNNPACEKGAPITIGETYIQEVLYRHVDCHHNYYSERRVGNQLRLKPSIRRKLLKSGANFTEEDIAKSIMEIRTIQAEREESIKLYRRNEVKFFLESPIRKLRDISNFSFKNISH